MERQMSTVTMCTKEQSHMSLWYLNGDTQEGNSVKIYYKVWTTVSIPHKYTAFSSWNESSDVLQTFVDCRILYTETLYIKKKLMACMPSQD